MKTPALRFVWWLMCCAMAILASAAVAQMPRNFIEKGHRLVLCEAPEPGKDGRATYRLTKQVVAERAEAAVLLDQLDKGQDSMLPAVGLGFLAYIAVVDRSGLPLMVLAVRCESGITSIHHCADGNRVPGHPAGAEALAIKVAPEFTRAVYETLKKKRPQEIAAHEKFYASIGTSLEEMLFHNGAQKLSERTKK